MKVTDMAKSKGLEVDRRVGIALSVLPPSQKIAIEKIIRSQQSFLRAVAVPGRVQQMRTSGQPLYMMKVTPGLRLIYTTVGDTYYVVDLVERATLNHFTARKSVKKATQAHGKRRNSQVAAQKASDLVET
jgi:hypothetical protein